MITLQYPRELLGGDGDLNAGKSIPPEILLYPQTRALFFFKRVLEADLSSLPARLAAEIFYLDGSDEVNDLVRRVFAHKYPFLAMPFFPKVATTDSRAPGENKDTRANINQEAIEGSLRALHGSLGEDPSSNQVKAWAVCCRAVYDLGLGLRGPLAEDWLASCVICLNEGQHLPAPNLEQTFWLAVRWALAAVPALPEAREAGVSAYNTLQLECLGRARFAPRWAGGQPEGSAWRAATYLAVSRLLWGRLLAEVTGFSWKPARPAKLAADLEAPHGADHYVALVGAKGAGKTSYLYSLAEGLPGFAYQKIDNDGKSWAVVDPNATGSRELGGESYERRGYDQCRRWEGCDGAGLENGIRLLALDVKGEDIAGHQLSNGAEYREFFRKISHSGVLFVAGPDPQATQQVCEKFVELPGLSSKMPAFFLINFADTLFTAGDTRRHTLLGAEGTICDVANLITLPAPKSESSTDLLGALRDSLQWAAMPLEALAFEQAIETFRGALEAVFACFEHVTLGFCSGQQDAAAQRGSAAKLWLELHARVAQSTAARTRGELNKRFVGQSASATGVVGAVNNLTWLRKLGARLCALGRPEVKLNPEPEKQIDLDLKRLETESGAQELFREINFDFTALVQSLPPPAPDAWIIDAVEKAPWEQPIVWLLASLGVPVAQRLEDFKGAITPTADSRDVWSALGWNGEIKFHCRWDKGAKTVPCQWREDGGHSCVSLDIHAARVKLGPGDLVASLIARCLRKADLNSGGNQPQVELGVGPILRALTHSRKDRGLFGEQALEPGSSDPYAYAAVSTNAERFKNWRSVAACQQNVVDMLEAAANIMRRDRDRTIDRKRWLDQFVSRFTISYLLKLRHIQKGGALDEKDSLGALDNLGNWLSNSYTAEIGLKRLLKNCGFDTHQLAAYREGDIADLEAAAVIGAKLIEMVDLRLEAYLHFKLCYAQATGWFPLQEEKIRYLKGQLELARPRAFLAAYQGDEQIGRERSYSEIFKSLVTMRPLRDG